MKIMIVVGARPNFMKAGPIVSAIRRHNQSHDSAEHIRCLLVHTGQHYDQQMSDQFFQDLQLPAPDIHLGVGSGSHAAQTAEIMRRFEEVLQSERPDVLVVVGDVNSTLGCALVAAKMPSVGDQPRPLIAHVEAGLRSFDRSMPEEINRILTDHLADLLFVTEDSGVRNLRNEGIPDDRIFFVGNTMIDSVLTFQEKAESSPILEALGLRRQLEVMPYALLTLHRPSNVDQRDSFLEILAGIEECTLSQPVVFPVHPRTRKQIHDLGLQPRLLPSRKGGGLLLIDPLGYLDFLCLMKHAALVITDSGGIQEETTCLGVPCVTVRENTERPVTVNMGTNLIAGVEQDGIRQAIHRQMNAPVRGRRPEKWDGCAAPRILQIIRFAMERRLTGEPLACSAA